MDSIRYIGLDLHRDTISAAVLDNDGTLMMQSVLATRAAAVIDFLSGIKGTLHVTFEECRHSALLYDLLTSRVANVVVCNPRKNALLKFGNKSDAIDAAGPVVTRRDAGSGVSRRKQRAGGIASGALLWPAYR
jgi:hypothetical protein